MSAGPYRVFRVFANTRCYLKACAPGEEWDWTHHRAEADVMPRAGVLRIFRDVAKPGEVWGFESVRIGAKGPRT